MLTAPPNITSLLFFATTRKHQNFHNFFILVFKKFLAPLSFAKKFNFPAVHFLIFAVENMFVAKRQRKSLLTQQLK